MLTVFLLTVATLVLIYVAKRQWNNHGLPPGPRGFPLVGNLLQLGTKPSLKLCQWALQYGKLYTIKFGHRSIVVINDVKVMRELLGMKASTGSFTTEMVTMIPQGRYGLHADGEARLEQRRFFVRALREFGIEQGAYKEMLIMREATNFIYWIKNQNFKARTLYVGRKLIEATGNVTWAMIFGEHGEASQESKNVALLNDFSRYVQTVTKSGLLFFPWIKYLSPVQSGYKGYKKVCENIYKHVENCTNERARAKENETSTKFIADAYIDKVKFCGNSHSSFYGELGSKHSTAAIISLFLGAGESPGNMINWSIFYLSVFPKVQEKLQGEIDDVIGRLRDPGLMDKNNMPYTEAFILEALRFATLVPFGVMHEMVETITFQNYQLPKGVLLMPNLYHVHNDKAIWEDPENFRPERFLETGRNLKEFVVAFQPGKRTCPGKQIAMDIIFLFLTKLFQSYTFAVDKASVADEKEYLEPVTGFGLHPQNLPVVAMERH